MDPKPATDSTASCSSLRHPSVGSSSAPPSSLKSETLGSDDVSNFQDKEPRSFKQFDIVDDFSDHHFASTNEVVKPSNVWIRKVQQEWKILEKDLPETILVRVYENRMDLLRAVIIGPAGTPYHDGLFFFDFQFPGNYPTLPPKAYYHSGGLRPNPNLYANGTVCLSLLNTWHGKGCEKWDSQKSTMLQILVSIQALVLNANPYFNEPGYSWTSSTQWGRRSSLAYNESTFLISCRTIIYSLRAPPKHFEDFVAEHFHKSGGKILVACRAYLGGINVGCFDGEKGQPEKVKSAKSYSSDFKSNLKKVRKELVKEFSAKGIDYCTEYLTESVQAADCQRVCDTSNSSNSKNSSSSTKSASSKMRRLCQYLLKIGKKVLPIDN